MVRHRLFRPASSRIDPSTRTWNSETVAGRLHQFLDVGERRHDAIGIERIVRLKCAGDTERRAFDLDLVGIGPLQGFGNPAAEQNDAAIIRRERSPLADR